MSCTLGILPSQMCRHSYWLISSKHWVTEAHLFGILHSPIALVKWSTTVHSVSNKFRGAHANWNTPQALTWYDTLRVTGIYKVRNGEGAFLKKKKKISFKKKKHEMEDKKKSRAHWQGKPCPAERLKRSGEGQGAARNSGHRSQGNTRRPHIPHDFPYYSILFPSNPIIKYYKIFNSLSLLSCN